MSTPAVRVSRSYAPPQMLDPIDPMITGGTTTPPAEVKAAKCEDFLVTINWKKKKEDILAFSLQFWIFLRSVPDFRFQQHWPKKENAKCFDSQRQQPLLLLYFSFFIIFIYFFSFSFFFSSFLFLLLNLKNHNKPSWNFAGERREGGKSVWWLEL